MDHLIFASHGILDLESGVLGLLRYDAASIHLHGEQLRARIENSGSLKEDCDGPTTQSYCIRLDASPSSNITIPLTLTLHPHVEVRSD